MDVRISKEWLRLIFLAWAVQLPNSVAAASSPEAIGLPPKVPPTWRQDADLRAVHFIDEEYGWAVGDHGVILHTTNGGEIWRSQESSVSAQLSSVHFVSRERGWAAGGYANPLSHRSRAVLLHTIDGGRSWQRVPNLTLPWIQEIHFGDVDSGYAVGLSSAKYPSGVWFTRDGGNQWTPIQGKRGQHWSGASFHGDTALLWSFRGTRAWLAGKRIFGAGQQDFQYRASSCATLLSPNGGFWGSSSPMLTGDQGNHWHPLSKCPAFEQIELRCAASVDNHLWLAGSPGSRILHTADLGATWVAAKAPAHLPIHRLQFVNAAHGWAVGARGLVLATKDGGVTWQQQLGGAKRMSLLVVVPSISNIPWSLLARTSAAEEHRVHIVAVGLPAFDDPLKCDPLHRLQDAAMRVGASAEILTQLPVEREPSGADVLESWRQLKPNVVEQLSADLTRLIRIYRPDAVLASEFRAHDLGQSGVQQLVNHLVGDACDYAASDKAFPGQLHDLGLQPWSARRRLAIRETGGTPTSFHVLPTSTDASVHDLAQSARQLVTNRGEQQATAWALFGLRSDDQDMRLGWFPLSGLLIPYDSAPRRARTVHTAELALKRQHLQQGLQTRRILTSTKLVGRGIQRLEQVERLLGSDPMALGQLLFELSERELQAGDDAEAIRVLTHLVERHHDHPLAETAFAHLLQHLTSLERQWRHHRERQEEEEVIQLASAEQPAIEKDEASDSSHAPIELQVAQGVELADSRFQPDWAAGIRIVQGIKAANPTLYREPNIAFPIAAVYRSLDQVRSAQTIYRQQSELPETSAWFYRCRVELEIANDPSERTTMFRGDFVSAKPYLDGQLDDPCWQLPVVELQGPNNSANSQLMIGHDDEYLYVAASCPKRSGARYLPQRFPRPRDADLRTVDRIELRFDINRDYTSWWTIEIDHRGWTRDALLGDESWDPSYFVAASSTDNIWTVEVAIPLDELGPEVHKGAMWAVGLSRVVPGSGVELPTASGPNPAAPDLQGVLRLE